MTKLIYIDTNVYLDLLIGRRSGFMPNDDIARNILNRALKCEFHIIICDFLLMEIKNYASKELVGNTFKSLIQADKVTFEAVTSDDERKAHILAKNVPFGDRVHFVVAERCGAEYIVTNDKHFNLLNNKVKAIKPNLL